MICVVIMAGGSTKDKADLVRELLDELRSRNMKEYL